MSLCNDLFPPDLPEGVTYLPDFITAEEESLLLASIDQGPWDLAYQRRRKHFGKRYDMADKGVTEGFYPGPLPDWLLLPIYRCLAAGLIPEVPHHALINEYLPGQGIADHVDRANEPGGTVCSLSLGASAEMVFTPPEGRKHAVFLEPRSLVHFQGPARDIWTHGIPARKADRKGGLMIPRGRRVSVTFRTPAKAAKLS